MNDVRLGNVITRELKNNCIWYCNFDMYFSEIENPSNLLKEAYAKISYLYVKAQLGLIHKVEVYEIMEDLELSFYVKDSSSNGNVIQNTIFSYGIFKEKCYPSLPLSRSNGDMYKPWLIDSIKKSKGTDFLKSLTFKDWMKIDQGYEHCVTVNPAVFKVYTFLAKEFSATDNEVNQAFQNYYSFIKKSLLKDIDKKSHIDVALRLMNYVEDPELIEAVTKSKQLSSLKNFVAAMPYFEKYVKENKKSSNLVQNKIDELKKIEEKNEADVFIDSQNYCTINIDSLLTMKKYNLNKSSFNLVVERFLSALKKEKIISDYHIIDNENIKTGTVVYPQEKLKYFSKNDFENVLKNELRQALKENNTVLQNIVQNFESEIEKVIMNKDVNKKVVTFKSSVKKF